MPGRSSSAITAAFVVCLGTLVGLVVTSAWFHRWLPLIALMGVLGSLWLSRHRFQSWLLSPVWVTVLLIAGVGTIGFVLGPQLNGLDGGGLRISQDPETARRTAWLFAGTAASVVAGALLVAVARPRRAAVRMQRVELSRRARSVCLWLSWLPGLLIVTSLGSDLIRRDQYLAASAGSAGLGVGQQLGVGAVAVLGYLAATERGGRRLLACSIAVGYLVITLGLGSRRLALLPLVFAIGILAARLDRTGQRAMAVGVAASALLLPFSLFFRYLGSHGLEPYLGSIDDFSIADVDLLSTANNVLIAYPIAGQTAFAAPSIPLEYLLIELNPLPGRWAGWYEISGSLSLNRWTPFSAVGELGNLGPWALILTWGLIGSLLAYLDRRVRNYLRDGRQLVAVMLIGLAGLFALQILQYNLRNSFRLLVYALAIDILVRVLSRRRAAGRERVSPVNRGKARESARPEATASKPLAGARDRVSEQHVDH